MADLLGERGLARQWIRTLVEILGLEFLAEALAMAADAFAQDGPLLRRANGDQLRTAGGVFFEAARRIARDGWQARVSAEQWQRLFPSRYEKRKAVRDRHRERLAKLGPDVFAILREDGPHLHEERRDGWTAEAHFPVLERLGRMTGPELEELANPSPEAYRRGVWPFLVWRARLEQDRRRRLDEGPTPGGRPGLDASTRARVG